MTFDTVTFVFFLEILSFLSLSTPFWLLFFILKSTLAPCLAQCLLLIFIATSSLICIAGDVTSSCSINFYIKSTILSSWHSPRPLVPTYWTILLHFHAVISVFLGTKRIIFLFIRRSHAAGELLNTMLITEPPPHFHSSYWVQRDDSSDSALGQSCSGQSLIPFLWY